MTDVLYWMVYTLIVTSPSQIKNDQPRKEFLGFGITGDAAFHPGGVTCDAHDARVSVLHEVCVCRFAVLHVTCIYVLFRGSVCARVDHVLMYDGVVPRHCARCSCV